MSLRRIKSVSHIVGGVAGGEKFIHSGIFFKLSRDWKGIYGSDGHAIKAAELELKGTMALLDCRISGLHFPLMALIRYESATLRISLTSQDSPHVVFRFLDTVGLPLWLNQFYQSNPQHCCMDLVMPGGLSRTRIRCWPPNSLLPHDS